MGYRAFLFDMDGTLIDNMGIHSQVWSEYLADLGVSITPPEFFARAAGRTNAEILRLLIGPHLQDDQVEDMSAHKENLYRLRYRPIMQAVNGLEYFLRSARAFGCLQAVASSAGLENIAFHLSGLGLNAYFQTVVGAEDVRHGKPNPDLFLTAAERLGVNPAECLVFEDTPTGLEAARRAGMRAIALTTSYPAETLSQNPAVLRVAPDFASLSPQEFLS
jgi:beta-phosphoglucomutase family hydrolase